MRGYSSFERIEAPALLRAVAVAAMAIGVGVWGALLLAPSAAAPPPALHTQAMPRHDTSALAQWFGGAALRVRVAAVGVIAADDGRGAALLSVGGAPPRAYRVGQSLAPGVILDAVGPAHVAIAQDGVVERVDVPAGRASGVRGFVPVPTASAGRP